MPPPLAWPIQAPAWTAGQWWDYVTDVDDEVYRLSVLIGGDPRDADSVMVLARAPRGAPLAQWEFLAMTAAQWGGAAGWTTRLPQPVEPCRDGPCDAAIHNRTRIAYIDNTVAPGFHAPFPLEKQESWMHEATQESGAFVVVIDKTQRVMGSVDGEVVVSLDDGRRVGAARLRYYTEQDTRGIALFVPIWLSEDTQGDALLMDYAPTLGAIVAGRVPAWAVDLHMAWPVPAPPGAEAKGFSFRLVGAGTDPALGPSEVRRLLNEAYLQDRLEHESYRLQVIDTDMVLEGDEEGAASSDAILRVATTSPARGDHAWRLTATNLSGVQRAWDFDMENRSSVEQAWTVTGPDRITIQAQALLLGRPFTEAAGVTTATYHAEHVASCSPTVIQSANIGCDGLRFPAVAGGTTEVTVTVQATAAVGGVAEIVGPTGAVLASGALDSGTWTEVVPVSLAGTWIVNWQADAAATPRVTYEVASLPPP